ncbi:MAG: chorismate mutase [Fibromonadaceae bacterium]|jgi:chorismate mutase|nr:chorismate mutase [Fibromonadaceae bacterium]
MTPEIENLRQKIDSIEDSLISILNERAKYVLEIGKIKKAQGLPIADSKREEIILKRVAEKNPGPMSNEFMVDVFKKIIDESIKLESKS